MNIQDLINGLFQGPSWLEQANQERQKSIANYLQGGVPQMMADTSGTQGLAGGFGGTTIGRGYHGTKQGFTKYDFRKAGASDPGLVGKAVYLSPSPEQASSFAMSPHYGKGDAPNVMPFDVNMDNPMYIRDGILPDGRRLSEIHKNGITKESAASLQQEIKDKGHDGVIFTLGDEPVQYAVFNTKGLKSPYEPKD